MIIYFVNIGLDPQLPWEYDEETNRATCSPPWLAQGKNSTTAFKMPPGMSMENEQFVIHDVKEFKKLYKHSTTNPLLLPPNALTNAAGNFFRRTPVPLASKRRLLILSSIQQPFC